jgi:hypothetical protein
VVFMPAASPQCCGNSPEPGPLKTGHSRVDPGLRVADQRPPGVVPPSHGP